MTIGFGIGLAFVAMLCWGIGDFWIQRSTRKVGDLGALFFCTAFGAVVLLPFVYKDIPALFAESPQTLVVLGVLCVSLLIAAILDFEALRVGKLAVVEPIWSFEVPVAGLLAFFILNERIGALQILLIVTLLVSLAFVSLKKQFAWEHLLLERGTILAFLAAVLMGGANFFMGWFSRLNDPLMGNFLTDVFIAVVTGVLILIAAVLVVSLRMCVRIVLCSSRCPLPIRRHGSPSHSRWCSRRFPLLSRSRKVTSSSQSFLGLRSVANGWRNIRRSDSSLRCLPLLRSPQP